ncbi:MAG: hypothetical protein KF729_09830 [Sandaracinaceae bacterium]|nr:hypothetical protein [Sandaracinaceae bacterium]
MLHDLTQHPLVLSLLAAQLATLVIFVHQGTVLALLYRATRQPELLRYAHWCFWSALVPVTQLPLAFRLSPDAVLIALHATSIVVPMMMMTYMQAVAAYLGIASRWLHGLARVQPAISVLACASLGTFLFGGEPFLLGEGPPGPSLIAAMVHSIQPRYLVHPAYLAVSVLLAIVNVVSLLVCARRAPTQDRLVQAGIVITLAAIAFEMSAFGLEQSWAVPAIFAANLLEVLRITYVSTWRAGAQAIRLEHELERQRHVVDSQVAALDAAAHLSTLGAIARELGHEMRNPVASAALYVEAARRRAVDDRSLEPLERATRALEHLDALLGTLGRYGWSETATSPVRLRDAIVDAASLCGHRIRQADAELSIDVCPSLVVLARPGELIQVFVNLIANACDAVRDRSERWIRIAADRRDQLLSVRVCDAGPAPSRSVAETMFRAPFTTKGAGGVGLGLPICKRVVESLGGSIALDRRAATTEIVVELPAAEPEASE